MKSNGNRTDVSGFLFTLCAYGWFGANYLAVRALFPGCEAALVVMGAFGSTVGSALFGFAGYLWLGSLTAWDSQPSSLTLWWRRRQHERDLRR